MPNAVLLVVVAALLLFLLWSIERRRADVRFRLWVLGWSLLLVHSLILLWHFDAQSPLLLRRAHPASIEVLAGICFILSNPAFISRRHRLILAVLLGLIPISLSVAMILLLPKDIGVFCVSIVGVHGFAIMLTHRNVGQDRSKFVALSVIYILSAAWMLGALASSRPELVLAAIPAEVFLINALLFSKNYSRRSLGNLATVAGFLLWAGSSFAAVATRGAGAAEARLLPSLLDLAQLLAAVGMTMIVLEEDANVSRELAQEYEALFNNNPNAVWIYDRKTLRLLSCNPASAAMHGYTAAELRKKKLTEMLAPGSIPKIMETACADLHRATFRSMHVKQDGTEFPVSITAYKASFRGREATVALGEDLTERERMMEQLVHQAHHDALTGLPNRGKLMRKLEEMLAGVREQEAGCALILLRIERFDKVNENHGYLVGDKMLKETARLLLSDLGEQDALGRTGSGEFAIALGSVPDGAAAEDRARRLLLLFDEALAVDGYPLDVSVRMGMAVFPEDSDDAASIWRDAARAQAQAQRYGSEHLVRLSRTLSRQAQEDSRIEQVMRRALVEGGFEVFYQPIVDCNRKLCGMEALLRLRDEDGSMISPAVCIPIAESAGLIIPIGRWVLAQVCSQLRSWQMGGHAPVPVAINVSALQIVQRSFCSDVLTVLEQFGLDPSLIHFELTESSVMPRDSLALENMVQLAAQGFHFSIDDFGTGFSSLGRLHQLPVSILKIDRSFVSRMLEPNGTLPIVTTIISMAHSMRMDVVAEGVETEEQFEALLDAGCDQFQGFLCSRPVDAAGAVALLLRKSVRSFRRGGARYCREIGLQPAPAAPTVHAGMQ